MLISSFARFSQLTAPQTGAPMLLTPAALTMSLPDCAAAEQIAGSIVTRFPALADPANLDAYVQPVASALWLDLQRQFGGGDLSVGPEVVDYLLAALYATLADSLGDQTTLDQIQLQQVMDRLSKVMATLSTILKKMSDTSDAIVSNLK